MIILAVDPGKTAGLVQWRESEGEFQWWQDTGMWVVQHVDYLLRNVFTTEMLIACERYTFTSVSHTRQYDALEMIGALRYLAFVRGARFELQSRGDKSRVSNDVIARCVGVPADRDHARDAARHCLVAIARHRPQSGIMMQLAGRI